MKLRYKISLSLIGVVGVLLAAFGVALSYDSECAPAPQLPGDTPVMKAIHFRCYGSPDVLTLEDTEKPVPADDEVLVRIRAAAVNPLDWHYLRGEPYMVRLFAGIGKPKNTRLGVDFSGTVEAVGSSVTYYRPGDEVFGGARGAFADYVTVREDGAIAAKPANVSHEGAASVAIAAVTALQGLRDKGNITAGQRVLINGASGGVGTFAVQIAKAYGAEVTGVCSTRNLDMVRSIGADHVVDYTREDFTRSGKRYDLILDMVGNHSLLDIRHALEPDGTLVQVGDAEIGNWIDPLLAPLKSLVLAPFIEPKVVSFIAQLKPGDMAELANLMRAGKLTPVIDRQYALDEIADAIRYSERGHARGKIVVTINRENDRPE
ncbi:MAG: NAD(P)-dependent alcohol dehydrogenase [Lysobacterales bacterium]|jgi:NADPH:quinone reductase-like Zn-dependent oxidoreductase